MHQATRDILRFFDYAHLPPKLAAISKPLCELAHYMAASLDGAELTAGLRKLLEAKDCFVRAAVPAAPKPRDPRCDCQAPEPSSGAALISNSCPIHGGA